MSLPIKKLLLLLFLLPIICPVALLAQARLTTTISPSTIGKNETAELRLMIENAHQVTQINPPSLKDFLIINGPNQESGMETNNGVTKQYIGITYQLQPKAKGNFTISGATAVADGKTLKSNRVTIQVTSTSAVNNQNSNSTPFGGLSFFDEPVQQTNNRDLLIKKGENITAKIDKNIFIKVDVDKTNCYIGEPIVVTYKLYTRLKSESNIIKNPSFNGFSVIDLSQPGSSFYTTEKLNGREYNVYTLRKSQLYPLQAGAMELETSEVENNIHFVKEEFLKNHHINSNDVLNDDAIAGLPTEAVQNEKITLQSKRAIIDVKALPEINKPASFKGAVGNFMLDAGIEKNNFTTDDVGKLQLLISGQGNMDLINAPEIKWPDGIESYEPTIREALNKQDVPVSGSKRFEYSFIITKAGTYTLPAVEYSYFNNSVASYKTLTTKPFVITVTKGTGKAAATNSLSGKSGKEHFFDAIFTNRFWIIIPVALIIFISLFFWIKNENKKDTATALFIKERERKTEILEENEIPGNPLANTEERLIQQDSKGFYEVLNKEIRNFLAERLAVSVETINKKRIAEELDEKGVPVTTSLQIQQLLNDIEWQLYTPYTDENKMQEMYQTANTIVHSLYPPKH